ncbi:MAG: PKD domain-containing protein, partial [Verrucomicrobiota bacterium]
MTSTPEDGDVINPAEELRIVFNRDVDATTLTPADVTLTGPSGNIPILQVEPDESPAIFVVHPGATLLAGSHTLAVDTDIHSSTGLVLSAPYTVNFEVDAVPPVAVIEGDTSGAVGMTLRFEAAASSDDEGIVFYRWNFGDVSNDESTGTSASHFYDAAGQYTVTVTVVDAGGLTDTATLTVDVTDAPVAIHVPWKRTPGGVELPHETWTGKTITHKAVAWNISPPFNYQWEFGDGQFSPMLTASDEDEAFALEAQHAYVGPVGATFTATVRVFDNVNNVIASDTYPIVMRPLTLATERNVAIDEGLWYLHKNMIRRTIDSLRHGGEWEFTYGGVATRPGPGASAVHAFEIHEHLESDDPMLNPYVDTVRIALQSLFDELVVDDITGQVGRDPDVNGNGIGITIADGTESYELGMVMDALLAGGRRELSSVAGRVGIFGRTYGDVIQDMADQFAFAQREDVNVLGGWRYQLNDGEGDNLSADNSANQWAAVGLMPAEILFGTIVPPWVKTANLTWVNYSRRAAGGYAYNRPDNDSEDSYGTTAGAMVQLAWLSQHSGGLLWRRGEDFI